MKTAVKILKGIGLILDAVIVILALLFGYICLRANRAQVETLNPIGEDIRHPKFAIVGQNLFLYAFKNTNFISYYTSPTNPDFVWLMGMLSPASGRMAKIDLKATETLANHAGVQ